MPTLLRLGKHYEANVTALEGLTAGGPLFSLDLRAVRA